MSKFQDLIGVVRGIQKVQNCAFNDYLKCQSQVIKSISDIKQEVPEVDVNSIIKKGPKFVVKSVSVLAYQVENIVKYKLNLSNKIESPSNKLSDVELHPLEPTVKSSNESIQNTETVLDPIDKEIIEEFRQKHPDIVKKEQESSKYDIKDYSSDIKEGKSLELLSQKVTKGHERRVPSSEVSRAVSFASLFARVGLGTATEYAKQFTRTTKSKSIALNDANIERIVDSLCRIRGAALKLGQMISLMDSQFIDPKLLEIMDRVRDNADFMPVRQMSKVLNQELGADWRELFKEFNEERPFAAASIGQVHKAKLLDKDGGGYVAVKIQYPGVKRSINSDINNLMSILRLVNIFPSGMHIEEFIEVAKREMAWECDYKREAEFSDYFADQFKFDPVFSVPKVVHHLSTDQILTSEFVEGVSLDKCKEMNQEVRDWIGTHMLRLCLIEIFQLRTMQTDPNWSNFLFNYDKKKIYLIDFGASRHYDSKFVDEYLRVIYSASIQDREAILQHSRNLGFLTGLETKIMEQAHIDAVSVLGEVFASDKTAFDFGKQSTTKRIRKLIPVMLEHRLTAPPEQTYSLHRKLAGGFLLCSKLKSRVVCKPLFNQIYNNYQFDTQE